MRITEITKHVGLAELIAELTEDRQGTIENSDGFGEFTGLLPYSTKAVERISLTDPVSQLSVNIQGLLKRIHRSRIFAGCLQGHAQLRPQDNNWSEGEMDMAESCVR